MTLTWLASFWNTIGLPAADIPVLLDKARPFLNEPETPVLAVRLLTGSYQSDGDAFLRDVAAVGERSGLRPETSYLLLLSLAAEPLKEIYRTRSIDEAIYWDSMRDIRSKYTECVINAGVPGLSSVMFAARFFVLGLIGIGRFEYEFTKFRPERYTRAGITLRQGDDVLKIHIPSGPPLTDEARMDSYRRAHAYFRYRFPDVTPIICSSWLMYPGQREFLPPESHILAFMSDFDIVSSDVDPDFHNAWRVFGPAASQPPETWPRDTRLRRAYAERICSGGSVGSGYGVLLFDGEKILR